MESLSFPHALFLPPHPVAAKEETGPKDKGRKNRNKGEMDFFLVHLNFIPHSSFWEELVYLIFPQHAV